MGQLLGGLGPTGAQGGTGGLGSGQQHGSALSLSDFFKMDEDQQAAVTAELAAAGGQQAAGRGPAVAAARGGSGGLTSPPMSPSQRLSSLHAMQQMQRYEGSAGNLVDLLGGPNAGVGSPGALLLHGYGSDAGDPSSIPAVGGSAAGALPDAGHAAGTYLYGGLGLGAFGSSGHLNLLGSPAGRGSGFMDIEGLPHLSSTGGILGGSTAGARHGGSPPDASGVLFGDVLPVLGGSHRQQQRQGLALGAGYRVQGGGGAGEGFLDDDDDHAAQLEKRGSSTGGRH